jgi:hypothetical protein
LRVKSSANCYCNGLIMINQGSTFLPLSLHRIHAVALCVCLLEYTYHYLTFGFHQSILIYHSFYSHNIVLYCAFRSSHLWGWLMFGSSYSGIILPDISLTKFLSHHMVCPHNLHDVTRFFIHLLRPFLINLVSITGKPCHSNIYLNSTLPFLGVNRRSFHSLVSACRD